MSDFNIKVIKEFRANQGKVGGHFEGIDLLLVHTTGAKSGKLRINPTAYFDDGKFLVIVASNAGADSHPDWYYNLVAIPNVIVEVGTDTYTAVAKVAEEPERTILFEKMAEKYPMFSEYKRKTERIIPVVKLVRE